MFNIHSICLYINLYSLNFPLSSCAAPPFSESMEVALWTKEVGHPWNSIQLTPQITIVEFMYKSY